MAIKLNKITQLKKNGTWNTIRLKDIGSKQNNKNKDFSISTVFSNSALKGIVEQTDYFDKKIANKDNLSSYFIVEEDDFVYNPRISNYAPYGPIHRNKTNKVGLVSPLYTVFKLDSKKCNIDYFEQYFKSSCWHKYMYSVANYGARSDRMNITSSDFFNLEITVPTLSEQQKIASILSTWDKAIELKEKLIEQKKEQKKGLMQKLLTGEVRLPGFKGEWKEVKLSKICTLETGKRPKGGVTTKGEIPSLGGENIYSDNGLNLTTIKKVNLEFYESMTKGQLKENDILINKDGAQTGKVALYKDSGLEKACINEHLFIVRTTKNISYKFLYYYLGSEEGQQKMKVRITSSAQPGLNSQFVKGFTLRIPVYEEQKLIGDILFSLDKELLLLKDEKMLLEKQKKGLMQLLLTGKVRVKV